MNLVFIIYTFIVNLVNYLIQFIKMSDNLFMIGPQPKNLNEEEEEYHDDVAEYESVHDSEYDDMPELIPASASDSDDDMPGLDNDYYNDYGSSSKDVMTKDQYYLDGFNKLKEFMTDMAIENDDESDNESNGDDEPDSEHNPEQNPKLIVESEPENDSENESRPEPVKEKKLGRLKILNNKLDKFSDVPSEQRWLKYVNLQYDIDEHVFECPRCRMGFKPSENFSNSCIYGLRKGYHTFKSGDDKTYIICKSNQKRVVV